MEPAEKITVTMAAEMLEAMRESVAAGEYHTTGEIVQDALKLWQSRRLEQAERLTALKGRVRRSLDDPRPSLSCEETAQRLEDVFARSPGLRVSLSGAVIPSRL